MVRMASGSKRRISDLKHEAMKKKKPKRNAYTKRNEQLKKLGLAQSYPEYLESDLWKFIRFAVLTAAKDKCQLCDGRATQVHHLKYDRSTLTCKCLFEKPPRQPKYLVALCQECHKRVEFYKGEKKLKKRSLRSARREFYHLYNLKLAKLTFQEARLLHQTKESQ